LTEFFKEDAFEPREIIGYVSIGEEHIGGILNKKPNIADAQRWTMGNFYLPDYVRATDLTNVDQAKVAIIEEVSLDTPLDEKHPRHYDQEMTSTPRFPITKTRAGALQGKVTPWEYQNRQGWLAMVGGISGLIAFTSKVVR
jgi:hypothetical protein